MIATASAAALSLGAIGLAGGFPPASAATGDESEAQARLIDGSLLSSLDVTLLDDLLAAVTTEAGNPSDAGPNNGSVDVGALADNLAVDVGSISLPLIDDGANGGLLDLGVGAGLGVLNGYAAAPNGQEAHAASGAVTGQGAIDVGESGDAMMARVDLTALLGQLGIDGLTDTVVDDLSIGLGALATTADQTAPDAATSAYEIAGAELTLHSPAVAGLSDTVTSVVDSAETAVNGVLGPDGTVQGALDALTLAPISIDLGIAKVSVDLGSPDLNATVDLGSVVDDVLGQALTDADGIVGIDLSTGTITVNLAALHADGLNSLDPNTNILQTGEIDRITTAIANALGDLTDNLDTAIRDAVAGIDLTITLNPTVGGDVLLITIGGDVGISINGTVGDFLGLDGSAEPVVDVTTTVEVCLILGACVDLGKGLLETALEGTVSTLLSTVGTALEGVLDTAVGGLGDTVGGAVSGVLTVLAPLDLVLEQIVTLTVNAQPTELDPAQEGDLGADSFTVRALSIALLPGVLGGVTLDLASSSVHTTALAPVADVTITAPTAGQAFTIAPGETGADVTVSGTGEVGADVTVTVGADEQATTVAGDDTWSVTVTDLGAGDHTATAAQDFDGATSTASVDFVVEAPADADSYEPAYAATDAVPNQPATSAAPTFTDAGGAATTAPTGTSYAIGPDAPTGASVDPATGEVTWTPADSDAGTTVTVPVVVSYPDATTDAAGAPFTVGDLAGAYNPAYATTAAVPGAQATSDAPTFTDAAGATVTMPTDATFALDSAAPSGADIDGATGVVTWTPGIEAANTIADIPVLVTYADDSSDAVDAPFEVGSVADALAPAYAPTDAQPNVEATSQEPTFTDTTGATIDAPTGTTFALGASAPAGAEIDGSTGAITWTPGTDDANSVVNIPVVVTYPDDSSDDATAAFNVGDVLDSDAYTPAYESTPVIPGETATSEVPTFTDLAGDEVSAPAGTTFAAGTEAPTGAVVNETTGAVTWTPSFDQANSTVSIPVVVTYPDATTDEATAPFEVGSIADALTPAYTATDAIPGESVTSEVPTFTDNAGDDATAPDGTTFALGADAPSGAAIDAGTGAVTWTPGAGDANSTVSIPVVVTYPDATTDEATAPFEVGSIADALNPAYTATAAVPGVEVTSEPPTFTDNAGDAADAPDGTTFALGAGAPSGATIDTATGAVTWTPAIADAGSTVTIPVVVLYPDASSDEADAPFQVGDLAEAYTPAYADTAAFPGVEVTTAPPTFTDGKGETADAPEGTIFALGADAPAGATIDGSTGVITWTPGAGDANSTVDIPVVVTYPDDSTDDVNAAFVVGTIADDLTPAYGTTEATVDTPVTSDPPTFTGGDGPAEAPTGTTFALGDDAPAGASIDEETGAITWTPTQADSGTTVQIPVVVTYPDASSDTVEAPFDVQVSNADASASAAASANADDDSNAAAQAAAQAAATADADTTASAAADASAESAAAVAANADASSDASSDVSSDANAAAAASSQAAANADATSQADANASAASSAAADVNAAAASDASSEAAANADASSAASADASADANADLNADASASAAASANADDDSNAAAQAAAQAAATADADTTASAAADASAESAAAVAANADASSDASSDVSSDANAAAAASSQAAANADATSQADANASAASSAAADVNAAAASDASSEAAANADASSAASADASADANADLNADASAAAEASANVDAEASANASAETEGTADDQGAAADAQGASAQSSAAANGSGDGQLPDTGSTLNLPAILGAMLLALLGAGVLVANRKRG
ncbi:YPDG domain-containing protein [Pseudactinotalea sp. HY158]|uniref:YPDG domain-containing protein n=1 Tax=Pseudactinotalea sp. HY158 TaxID=2654547 RepID=UPI001892832E|nr:YPDG domain-containing protein [Pseudactinotalea sp. HY158]